MVKRAIHTTAFVGMLLVSAIPAMAQNALQSSGAMGNLTNTNGNATAGNGLGWANYTSTNGAGTPGGPRLFGTNSKGAGPFGQSGAATSAPFQGTFAAPGNFALRQQGLGTLPPTQLTSIIQDSGMSDSTYGDEGTDGPPPLEDFTTIDGGLSGGMTTGHQSDAPSAWGYPN